MKEKVFIIIGLLICLASPVLGGFWMLGSGYNTEFVVRNDSTLKYKKAYDLAERGSFFYHYEYATMDPERRFEDTHIDWPMFLETGTGEIIAYPLAFAFYQAPFIAYGLEAYFLFVGLAGVALELILIFLLCRWILELPRLLSLLAPLLYMLTSPLLSLNSEAQETSIGSAIQTVALFGLLVPIAKERLSYWHCLMAGCLIGLSFTLRQEYAISGLALCVALLVSNPLAPVKISGNGFSALLKRSKWPVAVGIGFLFVLLLFVIVNLSIYETPLGARFQAVAQEESGFGHRIHVIKALLLGNFDLGRPAIGLFLQAPYLLFPILLGLLYWRRLGTITRILFVHGGLTILLIALTAPNDGWSASFGPRYMLPAYGSLIVAGLSMVYSVTRGWLESRAWRYATYFGFGALILIALQVMRMGMPLVVFATQSGAALQHKLIQLDAPVASASSLYYLGGITFQSRTLLQIKDVQDLDYLRERLEATGHDYFYFHEQSIARAHVQELSKEIKAAMEARAWRMVPVTLQKTGTERQQDDQNPLAPENQNTFYKVTW